MRKFLIAALLASPLFVGSAMAQTTTPPASTPPPAAKAAPKAKAPAKARSAESIECSKQADAKGLHGKARKTFRAACKKQLLKKA